MKVVAKLLGEQEGTEKVLDGDLATSQLGFQCRVPIHFEGLEEDLAIALVNADLSCRHASPQIQGRAAGALITTHREGLHPRFLGGGATLSHGRAMTRREGPEPWG